MQYQSIVDATMKNISYQVVKTIMGEYEGEMPMYVDPIAPKGMVYAMQEVPVGAIILWQFHLQQMVIAPDPIAYLGEHI